MLSQAQNKETVESAIKANITNTTRNTSGCTYIMITVLTKMAKNE